MLAKSRNYRFERTCLADGPIDEDLLIVILISETGLRILFCGINRLKASVQDNLDGPILLSVFRQQSKFLI